MVGEVGCLSGSSWLVGGIFCLCPQVMYPKPTSLLGFHCMVGGAPSESTPLSADSEEGQVWTVGTGTVVSFVFPSILVSML